MHAAFDPPSTAGVPTAYGSSPRHDGSSNVRLRDSTSQKTDAFHRDLHRDNLQEPCAGSQVDKRETHGPEFQLKQRNAFLALAGAGFLLAAAVPDASAQNSPGQWRLPNRASGRMAAQKPRTETQQVVIVPTVLGGGLTTTSYRVPIAVVPAVLMSDGSIFANFGFGYEPVIRACGGARMGPVIGSNGVILQQAPRPMYTQPVPNQMTPSQLMLSGVRVHYAIVSDMGRLACFNRDGSGLVYVYR